MLGFEVSPARRASSFRRHAAAAGSFIKERGLPRFHIRVSERLVLRQQPTRHVVGNFLQRSFLRRVPTERCPEQPGSSLSVPRPYGSAEFGPETNRYAQYPGAESRFVRDREPVKVPCSRTC